MHPWSNSALEAWEICKIPGALRAAFHFQLIPWNEHVRYEHGCATKSLGEWWWCLNHYPSLPITILENLSILVSSRFSIPSCLHHLDCCHLQEMAARKQANRIIHPSASIQPKSVCVNLGELWLWWTILSYPILAYLSAFFWVNPLTCGGIGMLTGHGFPLHRWAQGPLVAEHGILGSQQFHFPQTSPIFPYDFWMRPLLENLNRKSQRPHSNSYGLHVDSGGVM